MFNKPKISIIIPVYNVEDYVEKAVLSVINQTYDNLEIIIVNDGSTDLSVQKIRKLIKNDNRIVFIDYKENNGLSYARNRGIDVATGDFIGFVDADDTIDPTMYEKLLKSALKYNTQMAFCDILCMPSNIPLVGTLSEEFGNHIDLYKSRKTNVLDELLFLTTSSCNKLYLMDVFKQLRFPEGKLFEDLIIYSQLLMSVNRISFVREELYTYLIGREGSIMTSKDENYYQQRLQQWFDKYKEVKQLNRKNVSKRFFLKLHREYWTTKRKVREQFNEVNVTIKTDRIEFDFKALEKIWMFSQKYRLLRNVLALIEKPLKKFMKY